MLIKDIIHEAASPEEYKRFDNAYTGWLKVAGEHFDSGQKVMLPVVEKQYLAPAELVLLMQYQWL